MSRTPSLSGLLLVATLLAGLAAGAVVAAEAPTSESALGETADDVVTLSNTTNYAFPTPASDSRRGYVRGNVDVAGAVATAGDRLDGQRATLSFERRYESRNTSEARLGVVRSTIDRVEQRLADLDARQESLFRSYTNGTVSEEAFVRRLARLEVRATASSQLLDRVGSTVRGDAETTLPFSVQTRIAALGGELVTLPADVTTRLTTTVRGEADPTTVYVQGEGNGVVLATVDDGEFVRQATLRSAYTPDVPNQFAQSEDEPVSVAFDRARTLYPWVSDNLQSINRIAGFGDSDVYLIDLSHPHGTVTSYIHGGSTNIFHEQHRQRPDAVPTRLTASNANDTLALRVNATTETGPMQISLSRETTNTPVDAVVRIDGRRVGTTGSDGRLWAIRPSGSFSVNATTPDGTSVVVSP
jgi:hypothetical protein